MPVNNEVEMEFSQNSANNTLFHGTGMPKEISSSDSSASSQSSIDLTHASP